MADRREFSEAVRSYSEHETKAMRRLVTRTTKENLWLYVLTLLEQREYFAYEVRAAVKEQFGVEIAPVTAYVLLYKLQREELVERSGERQEGRRPARKYYAITEKGRRALSEARQYLQILAAALAPSTV
jgi:DNA-binding PadR family transcriptional regulator